MKKLILLSIIFSLLRVYHIQAQFIVEDGPSTSAAAQIRFERLNFAISKGNITLKSIESLTSKVNANSTAIKSNTADIKNATENSYNLLKQYHESLWSINPEITASYHLKDVFATHEDIKSIYDDIVLKKPFDSYLDKAQKELFYRTLKNTQLKCFKTIRKLELILKPNALKMNDSERLSHINFIQSELDKYKTNMLAFIEVFNRYAYVKKNNLMK